MVYLAIAIAAAIVFLVQAKVYLNHAFDKLEYKVYLSTSEVFEGDEVYLYEEIANKKLLPLPFLKVDTQLPDGLAFRISEKDPDNGSIKETFPSTIHSIFVLHSNQVIKRRWRIVCKVRGTYHLGSVSMLVDDIFGSHPSAKVSEPEKNLLSTLTVLPKAVDLSGEFTKSKFTSGDFIVESSLLSDPLIKAGVRDYMSGDPMNRINWMQTAARNRLMVNVEEFTDRHAFNIILNMQSRDREKNIPGVPSKRDSVELCVTVAASILDKVSSENVPVRLISNTPPSKVYEDYLTDDTSLFLSQTFRGKNDMLTALRILAKMELYVSMTCEHMMDTIVENSYSYTSGGNIIFISSYLSERMINFAYALKNRGISCLFYITGASDNAMIIPNDIEVYFKTYVDDGGKHD